jgi:hypothetical protein
MSQYPQAETPGSYPLAGYSADGFVPNRTPTAVIIISIFAIVLGSLGLLCGAIGLATEALTAASGGRNPFMPNLPAMDDTALRIYQIANSAVNLILSGVLLGAGIGGLRLRPLARRAMLGLSVFILVWATAASVLQAVWAGPKQLEYSHRLQAQLGAPTPTALSGNFEAGAQVGGVVILWVVWCALPICVLVFWRSERVVAAFETPLPPLATPADPHSGNRHTARKYSHAPCNRPAQR